MAWALLWACRPGGSLGAGSHPEAPHRAAQAPSTAGRQISFSSTALLLAGRRGCTDADARSSAELACLPAPLRPPKDVEVVQSPRCCRIVAHQRAPPPSNPIRDDRDRSGRVHRARTPPAPGCQGRWGPLFLNLTNRAAGGERARRGGVPCPLSGPAGAGEEGPTVAGARP